MKCTRSMEQPITHLFCHAFNSWHSFCFDRTFCTFMQGCFVHRKLKELKSGERVVVCGGWQHKGGGHAIMYVAEKQQNGSCMRNKTIEWFLASAFFASHWFSICLFLSLLLFIHRSLFSMCVHLCMSLSVYMFVGNYAFVVCNTGQGINYHPSSSESYPKRKQRTAIRFVDLPPVSFSFSFLDFLFRFLFPLVLLVARMLRCFSFHARCVSVFSICTFALFT